MTGAPERHHDPARAWAYEHYGFEDGPPAASPPVAQRGLDGRTVRSRPGPRSRTARVVAGGLLGSLLVAGVGGAAIATDLVDGGPGGGPGGNGRFGLDFDDRGGGR